MVQQGSVDWGALANSSFTFSVAVLNRISKANIDALTIAVAQTMFSPFNFHANGQKRLHDSLSKLKAFSSTSNVLWFGIGLKHVVRSLADTEQGACCVAVCACLSVSYNSFMGGQILKEICDSSHVPSDYRPSLTQWAALFDVCAGAVAVSQFPRKVEGFTKIMVAPEVRRTVSLPGAGPPEPIAAALLDLAKVSRGQLRHVVLHGSIDCAWLGAVAEWLLSLRVEVLDASGTCLYRSQHKPHEASYPQVTLIANSSRDTGSSLTTSLTKSRTHLIPDGRSLFGISSRYTYSPFFKGRSTWSGILHDTFGTFFDRLLEPQNLGLFARRLCSNLKDYPQLSYSVMGEAGLLQSQSTLQRSKALITFAIRRLPELQKLQEVGDDVFESLVDHAYLDCDCEFCSKDTPKPQNRALFCLRQIVQTIFMFLYTLSWLSVEDSVAPSSSGLLWLYMKGMSQATLSEEDPNSNPYRLWIFKKGVTFILSLFTGFQSITQSRSDRVSAICGNGVCVYVPSLSDPSDVLLEQLQFRVVPGHIEYCERLYKTIKDLFPSASRVQGTGDSGEDPKSRCVKDLLAFVGLHGASPSFQLLVEETMDVHSLNIALILSEKSLIQQGNNAGHKDTAKSVGALQLCLALRRNILNRNTCTAGLLEETLIWPFSTQSDIWSGMCSLSEIGMWTHKPEPTTTEAIIPAPDEWVWVDVEIWTPVTPRSSGQKYYFQYIKGSIQFLYSLLMRSSKKFKNDGNNFIVPASTCVYCLVKSLSANFEKAWKSHPGTLFAALDDEITQIELSADISRVEKGRKSIFVAIDDRAGNLTDMILI